MLWVLSRRSIFAFVCLALLSNLRPAAGIAEGAGAAHGNATHVSGSVQATERATSRPLAVQDPVFARDVVSTGVQARADLLFPSGLVLQLGAQTSIALTELGEAAGFAFDLAQGAILVDKPPASSAAPLTIDSVFGRVAVRGTSFFVGPSRGSFSVFVARGHVEVTAGGATVTVAEGQGVSIAEPGAVPGAVSVWSAERAAEALGQFD